MTDAVTDIVDPQPAPAAVDPAPAPPQPAPEPEPTPEPEPIAADAHGNKGKPAWWMRELANKDADNARLRAELDAALALNQRTQPAGQPAPQPAPSFTDQQIEARAHELNVRRDIAELDVRGTEKFGQQWTDSVAVLNTLGATNLQFMGDIITADKANAAELISSLAAQPEKLASIMRMVPAQRVAELVRISMSGKQVPAAPSKPATPAKVISNAPPPPPPLNAGGRQPKPLYADDLSDEEFNAQWDERATERARRRGFKV